MMASTSSSGGAISSTTTHSGEGLRNGTPTSSFGDGDASRCAKTSVVSSSNEELRLWIVRSVSTSTWWTPCASVSRRRRHHGAFRRRARRLGRCFWLNQARARAERRQNSRVQQKNTNVASTGLGQTAANGGGCAARHDWLSGVQSPSAVATSARVCKNGSVARGTKPSQKCQRALAPDLGEGATPTLRHPPSAPSRSIQIVRVQQPSPSGMALGTERQTETRAATGGPEAAVRRQIDDAEGSLITSYCCPPSRRRAGGTELDPTKHHKNSAAAAHWLADLDPEAIISTWTRSRRPAALVGRKSPKPVDGDARQVAHALALRVSARRFYTIRRRRPNDDASRGETRGSRRSASGCDDA